MCNGSNGHVAPDDFLGPWAHAMESHLSATPVDNRSICTMAFQSTLFFFNFKHIGVVKSCVMRRNGLHHNVDIPYFVVFMPR